MNTPFPYLRLRLQATIVDADYAGLVRGLTGHGPAPCAGILTRWDDMRVAMGRLDYRESLVLACDLGDHLRREYPLVFGLRRPGDRY